MKIKALQISNILSFEYHADIKNAQKIILNPQLNILIGQNGSGKSTVLEILNFVFKKILFVKYECQIHNWENRNQPEFQKNSIIRRDVSSLFSEYRLQKNWTTPDLPQSIQIEIEFDDIDKENLRQLNIKKNELQYIAETYSSEPPLDFDYQHTQFELQIDLNHKEGGFSFTSPQAEDPGLYYLIRYNYFNDLITLYNLENPQSTIRPLTESFTLISGYRNYTNFLGQVNLQNPSKVQLRSLKDQVHSKTVNANDQSEPPIFSLIKLRVAQEHFEKIQQNYNNEEAEQIANNLPFLLAINKKLKVIQIKLEVKLQRIETWEYTFSFYDTKRNAALGSIDVLSAGQKSIIHLVLEAYGRTEAKGGLVIIDEPELHLHHQFQDEYLRIIEEINEIENAQYILVTHSESFINSKTIKSVLRFALNENHHSVLYSPQINSDQNLLIKILDNTRSAFCFFATKVVFVEGDTDRYYFRAVFNIQKPDLIQSIAIIQMNGKSNFEKWKTFFESFGLKVYFIGDFDNVFTLKFGSNTLVSQQVQNSTKGTLKQQKMNNLTTQEQIEFKAFYDAVIADQDFLNKPKIQPWNSLLDKFRQLQNIDKQQIVSYIKSNKTNLDTEIETKYIDGIFILKKGAIEEYTGIRHANMEQMIEFCENLLENKLKDNSAESLEILNIVEKIANF